MQRLAWAWLVGGCVFSTRAEAGGLLTGENGAVAMQRGGAFVALADDPTALALNPAGLMKTRRLSVYLGSNLLDFAQTYQRSGVYPAQPGRVPAPTYVGTPYPEVKDRSGPQPLPMVAAVYRFSSIPLAVGLGVFAPPSFPNRDIPCQVDEDCVVRPDQAPAPQRYDIIDQDAVIVLPSVAVAYRILPQLDVGARFSYGFGHITARSFTWAALGGNPQGDPTLDGDFSIDVKDSFVPQVQLGALARPTSFLEIGAQWTSGLTVDAQGTGEARLGQNVSPIPGMPATLVPVPDAEAQCAPGGTAAALRSCVKLSVPMTAQVGARFVFRDGLLAERADIELDLRCGQEYRRRLLQPQPLHRRLPRRAR